MLEDQYVRPEGTSLIHVRDGESTRCGRPISDSAATADHYDDALWSLCPDCKQTAMTDGGSGEFADGTNRSREIENADCPGCGDGRVVEAPEAGYALCLDCGERGHRRDTGVDWWRNDPDSQWYVEGGESA